MSTLMDSASSSGIIETLSLVWTEVYMFALAAILYAVFSSGIAGSRFQAKNLKDSVRGTKPAQELSNSGAFHIPEQNRDMFQIVSRALRQGKMEEAMNRFAELHSNGGAPLQMTSRFLTTLAKSDHVIDASGHAVNLMGKLESQALEMAVAENAKRGDYDTCQRLRQVSDVLSIAKSPRTFEIFARHSSKAADLKSLVDEMQLDGVVFSKSLVHAVLTACAVTCDSELASELVARSELPRGDRELCAALIKVYSSCEQWDMACCIYEEVMLPASLKLDPILTEVLFKAAIKANRTDLTSALAESLHGDSAKQAKIIRSYGKDGNLRGAIGIFNQMKQSQTPLTSLVYNSILEASVQCGDMKAALNYFSMAKQDGQADVVSYNTVMKGHLADNKMHAALQLLKEMSDSNMPASLVTYHGILNARVQMGDSRGAWSLVEQMKSSGLSPNAVTCSILLKAMTTRAQAGDVSRVVELMDAMDTAVDEVLFASMAEACIRTGRLDLLSERTRMSTKSGNSLGLSAPTYGSMIKAYGQAHDIDQVWALWDEMGRREVRPTSITLGCMVEALVMNRFADQAWELAQKLWDDDTQKSLLNTVIYSTILKGFAMAKRPDRLMALYEEMREREIACNTITYNTMLNAFAQCGSMHRVPQLLEDMKAATPPVEPDIVTYSTMVKGFCASGDLDKGLQLLKEMELDGKFAPDEVMYNSLLDGCARQHRLEDALKLLDNMRDSGVTPSNYTLSIMVKLLGRARRLNQAFTMVKGLCEEHNFRANIQVYTCLIQACFHNRHPMKALALHDQLVEERCVPDQKTYVALVRGCLQAGTVDKAAEVVRCAFHCGGHSMQQANGPAPGVDSACLQEVIAKLGSSSEAARVLSEDVAAAQRSPKPRRVSPRSKNSPGESLPWRTGNRGNAGSSDRFNALRSSK